MKQYQFTVTSQCIEAPKCAAFVSGSAEIYEAVFSFDNYWDGFARTAVFECVGERREQLLVGDRCIVPWEILHAGAYLRVGVYGVDGNKTMPTVYSGQMFVARGAEPSAAAREHSADMFDQIVEIGQQAAEDAESAADSAQNASESATGAATSATAAENAKDAAIAALEAFHEPTATAQTLQPGTPATASYDGQNFTFGIPQGVKGDAGKSAYQSAQTGGYTGTEAQFNSDLAEVGGKYSKPSDGIPKTDLASAVQSSLDKADSALQEHQSLAAYRTAAAQDVIDAGISRRVESVESVIPTAASSTNKLVSASDMGDAIEAVEAKQLYATNAQGSFATKAALTATTTFYNADGSVATPTKNDVAYVLADESHSGKSAKYVIASVDPIVWGFVITFSDNTFTQTQMDAINSGVTSEKRAGYDSHVANDDIHVTAEQKNAWGAKYDKPSTGIPESDLASTVQESLGKANNAYKKPDTGIPKTDMAASVQTSLGLADSALQQVPTASDDTLGGIKVGSDFDIADDGTLSVYKALTLSASVSPSSAEIGSTIDDVTVSWTVNKTPVSQSVEGVDVPVADRSKALHDLGVTANRTFAVTAADARMSLTRNPGITFYRYVYSKVGSADAAPTQASECVKQADLSTFGNNGADFSYSAGSTLWLLTTKVDAQIQTNVLGQWADVTTINAGTVEFTQENGAVVTYYAYNTGVFGGTGSAKYRIR